MAERAQRESLRVCVRVPQSLPSGSPQCLQPLVFLLPTLISRPAPHSRCKSLRYFHGSVSVLIFTLISWLDRGGPPLLLASQWTLISVCLHPEPNRQTLTSLVCSLGSSIMICIYSITYGPPQYSHPALHSASARLFEIGIDFFFSHFGGRMCDLCLNSFRGNPQYLFHLI